MNPQLGSTLRVPAVSPPLVNGIRAFLSRFLPPLRPCSFSVDSGSPPLPGSTRRRFAERG